MSVYPPSGSKSNGYGLDASTSIQLTVFGLVNGVLANANFTVWDQGPEEHYDRDQKKSWAKRTLIMKWEDRIQLTNMVAGGGFWIGGLFGYFNSLSYPDCPSLVFDNIHFTPQPIGGWTQSGNVVTNMDANGNITSTSAPGPNSQAGARYCKAEITYKYPDYPDGGTASTLDMDFDLGYKTIPNPTGKPAYHILNPDGNYTNCIAPMVIRVPSATLTYTVYNCSQIPVAAVCALAGCVNSTAVTMFGVAGNGISTGAPSNTGSTIGSGGAFTTVPSSFVAQPGTLLYLGPTPSRRQSVNGAIQYDVRHRFAWRQQIWNYEVIETGNYTGWWGPITTVGSGNSTGNGTGGSTGGGSVPYSQADFTPIFTQT